MGMIRLFIDGKEALVPKGTKILAAAESVGITIPHLCFDPDLSIEGSCRLCLVEIAGQAHLLPSCATDCQEDMVITTENPRLAHHRTVILELLRARHQFECDGCTLTGECLLENWFDRYGVTQSRFIDLENQNLSMKDPNPFIIRDYDRCVMCSKCVRICDEVVSAKALTISRRGSRAHISVAFDGLLKQSTCIYCGQCIMVCPSGALRNRYETIVRSPAEIKKVETTCAFCSIGCKIIINVQDGIVAGVNSSRDEKKPTTNKGMLCSKGRFGWRSIHDEARLRSPLIRINGKLKPCSWDTALDRVAKYFLDIRDKYGANALAMFCSSRLTNEENYLAQKLMRAGIGTNQVHQCSKTYDLYGIEGIRTALGIGAMTNPITDIKENARVIFHLGGSIMPKHPVMGFQMLQNLRFNGAKLILAASRKSDLEAYACIFLKYKPGTEVDLLQGLLHIILRDHKIDEDFIAERTEGFLELKAFLSQVDLSSVSAKTGVAIELMEKAAHLYADKGPSMICHGVEAVAGKIGVAIMHQLCNMALMTGNIGKPGAGISYLRDQNNVQGSCDMGGVGRYYPGYQYIEDPKVYEKFCELWNVKHLPPHTDSHSLFLTIEKIRDQQIRGLYVLGSNPVKRNPGVIDVKASLQKLDFLVVQDLIMSETAEIADVVLPGASYAETDGTYTSADRRVQRVKKAVETFGNSKSDWQIICEVSNRLGYPMNYHNSFEIFEEIRKANPYYGGITYERLDEEGSLYWPCFSIDHPGTPVLHEETFLRINHREKGVFFTE